jgi:hypothetical protein
MDIDKLSAELQEVTKETEETEEEVTEGVTAEALILNDLTIIKNKLDTINADLEHAQSDINTNKKFNILLVVICAILLVLGIYNIMLTKDAINANQSSQTYYTDPFYSHTATYDTAQ